MPRYFRQWNVFRSKWTVFETYNLRNGEKMNGRLDTVTTTTQRGM